MVARHGAAPWRPSPSPAIPRKESGPRSAASDRESQSRTSPQGPDPSAVPREASGPPESRRSARYLPQETKAQRTSRSASASNVR